MFIHVEGQTVKSMTPNETMELILMATQQRNKQRNKNPRPLGSACGPRVWIH